MAIQYYQPQEQQMYPQQDAQRVFSQLAQFQQQEREQALSSIFEIDNEPIIEKIANYLWGKHLINGEWAPIDDKNPEAYRLMNEKGIVNVITLLRPHVDKMVILSDLMLDEIYVICRSVRFEIIRLLAEHSAEYDIVPTKANLGLILAIIDNTIFATVKRAFRGGERKHRETMLKLVETHLQKETDRSGGGFNPFRALMKRGEKP